MVVSVCLEMGPNGLEGGFDMVRYRCMLLPWAGTCPEAVCEAVMVPHFIECDALATMQLPVL